MNLLKSKNKKHNVFYLSFLKKNIVLYIKYKRKESQYIFIWYKIVNWILLDSETKCLKYSKIHLFLLYR